MVAMPSRSFALLLLLPFAFGTLEPFDAEKELTSPRIIEAQPSLQQAISDFHGYPRGGHDLWRTRLQTQRQPGEDDAAWMKRVAEHGPFTLMRHHHAFDALDRAVMHEPLPAPPSGDDIQLARLYLHERGKLVEEKRPRPFQPKAGESMSERLKRKVTWQKTHKTWELLKSDWIDGKEAALRRMEREVS